MLLQTLALFLLCLSSGMSATIGHYQASAQEDTPAAETTVLDVAVPENPIADTPEVDTMAADTPLAEEPTAEEPAAEEPAAEEPAAEESATEEPAAEEPAAEEPAAEESATDTPVADSPVMNDAPAAEDPAPEADMLMDDMPTVDAPAMEGLAEEALAYEAPAEEDPSEQAPVVEEALEKEPPAAEEEAEEVPGTDENNEVAVITETLAQALSIPQAQVDESGWGLNSIRDSFQAVNGYFDSLVELVGGRNGMCQYRCKYGKAPEPRPGYQIPEPNGCSSSLLGFQQFDMGIPAMTHCCNQLDECYDTCGTNKNRCDSKFRWCLHGICSDLKKSLGFVSKVEVCESVADALYKTLWTLGCKPYMNGQRAACFCQGEEKDEL